MDESVEASLPHVDEQHLPGPGEPLVSASAPAGRQVGQQETRCFERRRCNEHRATLLERDFFG
eukprot:14056007-Alexandrium_andersonii.AAC.1